MQVEYIEAADDHRGTCAVYTVKQGEEPVEFTCHFHGWDFTSTKPAKLSTLPRKEAKSIGATAELKQSNENKETGGVYVAYDRLTERPLPPGLIKIGCDKIRIGTD